MLQFNRIHRYREQGFGTLTVSVIILVLITLVTLHTARSTVKEAQVVANQHRSDQALSAANAALDYLVAYYDTDGDSDHDDNGLPDYTSIAPYYVSIVDPTSNMAVTAEGYFDRIDAPSITAIGQSDDKSAIRKIQIFAGNLGLLGEGDDSPDYPVIAHATSNTSGNMTIINRWEHKTIWTGSMTATSGSFETYVRPPSVHQTSLDRSEIVDPRTLQGPKGDWFDYTMFGTGDPTDTNSDVIPSDPNLANLSGDQMFEGFIWAEGIDSFENLAVSNERWFNANDANLVNKLMAGGGVTWVEGDLALNVQSGQQIGTEARPILLVVNGNFTTTGAASTGQGGQQPTPHIVGLIYVTQDWTPKGNIIIQGQIVVEGQVGPNAQGSNTIVYDPHVFGPGGGNSPPGSTAVVEGTWKDW